ncbi:DUF998 domain-containing protein [Saxibacter everestensis]|uniref:DUF998 domain-containing protein n=1 Tax=Saxibacter everestensis TaxID=2909229 RepID=A0ABY8QSU3_9MICO|nr:DUF998 domain-containing protein [Brevibacteriaceae bacterium ZFBP1038]
MTSVSTQQRRRLRDPSLRLGALAWGLSVLYFAAQIIAALAWPRPYDVLHHTISALGYTSCASVTNAGDVHYYCSPLHPVMNAGFIWLGVTTIAGAVWLRRLWSPPRSSAIDRCILALFIVCGISMIATGLAPGDVDIRLHLLAAGPSFICQHIALALVAIRVRRTHRTMALLTGLCALLGLVGTMLLYAPNEWGLPFGLMERIAIETMKVWMLGIAGHAMFRLRRETGVVL